MATLALSLAGNFVGGLVGGPLGATIGRALGALAGSAIDGVLFGEDQPKAVGGDVRLQGSSEGGAVPRLYGWSRLSGNIIWARELEVLGGENAGAKGMAPQDTEDEIAASFAVAFCEGEVHRLGRIWADGQLLETNGLTLRFYRGTETQLPDGLIEATQGQAPAYRGICYLVVEQLPLGRFGNRIPQLSVELCRVVGDLEPAIRAVTVIPGATEFGYDPSPRVRLVGRGQTVGENTHMAKSLSDWSWSIDELTALCPNLEHVALVVAWFGNDLRCGQCTLGPRVESTSRTIEGTSWRVAGLGRSQVPVVSSHNGGPAYGGTPSDAAVKAAIADLKAHGVAVTLYPIILMDVAAGNSLPDPYGGTGQPAYPWRGRITCDPAPGVAGSPDKSGVAAAQVATFTTGYRAMMLHYAQLAQGAGGVDAILIGSEMRGLTTVRGAANSFPFVGALVTLAADVRAIVGSTTKITYAADWSEYSGYQPQSEKFFHLDPLWASPAITAVSIDNYMPLADWRDGSGHPDATLATTPYELDYLAGNIAAGEGFDWYYANDTDRLAGTRTPISDGGYGEPWMFRFKDIRAWWSHWHYDRPAGVRSGVPTGWVPGSKPVWFTELGCGAVDKGANQPNIFGDDKSAESGRPYFSSGAPDPLMQRQFLRAHQRFWRDPANNPAGMVDVARIYHWTWDARPYPAFPAQTAVWADGPNHRTGHWLTGRLGAVASDELARAVAADHGATLAAMPAQPLVQGYVLEQTTTGRDALEPLVDATGLSLRAGSAGLELGQAQSRAALDIQGTALVRQDGAVLSRRRGDPAETAGRLSLSFIDRERDYQTGTVTALRGAGPLAGKSLPLVLDLGGARVAAEQSLLAQGGERETLEFTLPPSALALEPGDVIALAGIVEGPFEITEIRDAEARRITARTLVASAPIAVSVDPARASGPSAFVQSRPVVVAAHLPPALDDPARTRLALAAFAQPWPGAVGIVDGNGTSVARLTRRAVMGETQTALVVGPQGIWDRWTTLTVKLDAGHLAAMDALAVLAGANRIAVQTDSGEWEIIGFAQADLVAPSTYRLSQLLRGQAGTVPAIGPAAVGRQVMLLDVRVGLVAAGAQWLGTTLYLRAYAGSDDLAGTALVAQFGLGPALPLAPVHLRARRSGGDIALGWTRCSRADGDNWSAGDAPLEHMPDRYAVRIFDGAVLKRSFESGTPGTIYAAADQIADFGGSAGQFDFTVQQISPVLGPGHLSRGHFHG
ncbi:glycoside hydrolase/phage tail family protein [uncultured Devosia sp.]|uniref:baseplate multidomain protein megatron n=1 Tax=uncultured Devosia sp. TaxID=211434 RepID=UPI0035CB57E3